LAEKLPPALACFFLVWIIGDKSGIYVGGGVGLLIALLAPAVCLLGLWPFSNTTWIE
jgi:hypothetical protein